MTDITPETPQPEEQDEEAVLRQRLGDLLVAIQDLPEASSVKAYRDHPGAPIELTIQHIIPLPGSRQGATTKVVTSFVLPSAMLLYNTKAEVMTMIQARLNQAPPP